MKRPLYEVNVIAHEQDMVGECPMWHPLEQRLYWVDTRAPALKRLEADNTVTTWPMPTNIGSFVFREKGGLVAGLKHGFCEVDLSTGEASFAIDPEPENPENRLNDGRCDRRGRYWCGSRDPGDENPGGSLFRLNSDFSVARMDSGFIVSNGMAFSPDDKTLVFGDSRGDTVWKYDLDLDSGDISNKRLYLDSSGLPWRFDGATFDSEGFYWAALVGYGAVGRFDPVGRLDRLIPLPVSHPTMCNFGGPGLDVLYVTSGHVFLSDDERRRQPLAGSLFAITRLGVSGLAEPLFKG